MLGSKLSLDWEPPNRVGGLGGPWCRCQAAIHPTSFMSPCTSKLRGLSNLAEFQDRSELAASANANGASMPILGHLMQIPTHSTTIDSELQSCGLSEFPPSILAIFLPNLGLLLNFLAAIVLPLCGTQFQEVGMRPTTKDCSILPRQNCQFRSKWFCLKQTVFLLILQHVEQSKVILLSSIWCFFYGLDKVRKCSSVSFSCSLSSIVIKKNFKQRSESQCRDIEESSSAFPSTLIQAPTYKFQCTSEARTKQSSQFHELNNLQSLTTYAPLSFHSMSRNCNNAYKQGPTKISRQMRS